jgi:non-specific serine/threonine protein kinase/serine/threonine-protein kinase
MNPEPTRESSPTVPPAADSQFARVITVFRELRHPQQIGPYFVQELIGEGGMGSVYRAEQREPIQRTVAVKVIKLGMDTRDVIARFESERQALAMMDHPNVAKVLDAGATNEGRPYFVMEFVRGEAITSFADRHTLTVPQRLELFAQACAAVQHAHQKAIVHRDLKPSNLLVTDVDGNAQVKVIDFGVAKALSQRLTEKTLFTETGQLIGTPEYMAPEQAQAAPQDVDTRSDVYSLGVVLYELLSGALPFEPRTLRGAGYDEILRFIRETDPPRPSTRLSRLGKGAAAEVARLRQTPLATLARQLDGELAWIPLKAMQKERARRYASAAELAEDVANYVASRPLRAAPDSATYRLRKFLRRNKTGVAASAAMLFLLLAGIATTTWQAYRATRAEREARGSQRRAEDAAAEVREVNRFLTEDLLASADPDVTLGREMTVREALDRAAEGIAGRFRARPLTEAAVHVVLAETYDGLGLAPRALVHAQSALDLTRGARGLDDAQTLAATAAVGKALAVLHRHAEAEPLLRDAAARAELRLGPDDPATIRCLNALAMTLRMQRKFAEAEPLYRRTLESDRRVYGPRSAEVAQALNSLAVLLNTQRRASEAEPLYREALAIRAELLGEDHPSYLKALGNLARVLHDQGKLAEAEAMMRHVIREASRVLGEDHPSTLLTMNNLATLLAQLQRLDECEALHREVLTRRTRTLGADHPDTLQSMGNVAISVARRGRWAEAEELLRSAVERQRKILGEAHSYTVASMVTLATVYVTQGKFSEAEPLLSRACEPDAQAQLMPDLRAQVFARHGAVLVRLNQPARAETALLEARRRLTEIKQTRGDAMRSVLAALAEACDQSDRPAEVARWRAELAAISPATAPSTRAATQSSAPSTQSAADQ